MRTACHNILYTMVNSRAYADGNLNVGMVAWMKIMIAADVAVAVVALGLEVLIIKEFRKRRQS